MSTFDHHPPTKLQLTHTKFRPTHTFPPTHEISTHISNFHPHLTLSPIHQISTHTRNFHSFTKFPPSDPHPSNFHPHIHFQIKSAVNDFFGKMCRYYTPLLSTVRLLRFIMTVYCQTFASKHSFFLNFSLCLLSGSQSVSLPFNQSVSLSSHSTSLSNY